MYRMGHYIPRNTLIHRLDPRIKILSVILMSLMVLKGGFFTQFVLTLFLVMLMTVSRLTFRHVLSAVRPMLVFFAILFFLHLFFTDGRPIQPFPHWKVSLTYEGLYTGALTTWQFVLLIVTATLLTMTTSPSELISGIERLLRPLKWIGVPSHDVAMMISLALRFVPTLLGEIQRIRDAQAARGARLNHGPILNRLKAVSALVLPVVLSAFRRADALAMAMATRGYGGGKRTLIRELSLRRRDYVAMMVMALLTAGLVFVML